MSLPIDAKARKKVPIYSGFVCYFPDAIALVAAHSFVSNEQHNPGEPLHWNRAVSGDEMDALMRHVTEEAGAKSLDEEITAATAVAWRAMAKLQKLSEHRDRHADSRLQLDQKWISKVSREPEIDADCVSDASGACVATVPCMHSPENSKSQKLAVVEPGFTETTPMKDGETAVDYISRLQEISRIQKERDAA